MSPEVIPGIKAASLYSFYAGDLQTYVYVLTSLFEEDLGWGGKSIGSNPGFPKINW